MAPLDQPPLPKPRLPLRLDLAASKPIHVERSPSRSSAETNSRIHTPSSSLPDTPFLSTRPASPEKKALHSQDSSSFLTVLAAQERRVLELKDELQRAEVDLEKLKKHWAVHEATRKRNESRYLEQMQPLKTSQAEATTRQEMPLRAVQDVERRAVGPPGIKSSQKRVFAGSRHTRTLSLLSPHESASPSRLERADQLDGALERQRTHDVDMPTLVAEQAGHKGLCKASIDPNRSADKEAILETGKQLVGDFRHGLWTFFEDLKQVTVGEETPHARDRSSVANTKARASTIGAASVTKTSASGTIGRAQEQHGRKQYVPKHTLARLKEASPPSQAYGRPIAEVSSIDVESSDSDDGWESWDTPERPMSGAPNKSCCRVSEPTVSQLTEESSARTSMSPTNATPRPKQEPLLTDESQQAPWHGTLTPSELRKTTASLMFEWEKSSHLPEASPHRPSDMLSKVKKAD